MELTIKERVSILGLLPTEGNIVTLKTVKKLRESLNFSESEVKEYNIVSDGSRVTWSNEKQPAIIEIETAAQEIIKGVLRELNNSNKLHEDYITVYEKFIDSN